VKRLLFVLISCGGPHAQDPTTLLLTQDAMPPPTVTASTLTGARAVPPFHLESKHVERKPQQLSAVCRAQIHDAKTTVATIAQACALKVEGSPWSGKQDPTQASATFDFRGAKDQCYRIAATTTARAFVLTLMDAEGAIAAEYHTDDVAPVVLPEESLCFKDDATLRISASIGMGSGAFVVQAYKEQ